MSSKLKKAIGAVKDQTSISLAKVSSNASSNLEVTVLKATSHHDAPIDDKYVVQILQLVSSNKAHAATCARTIGKRIGRTRNWVVALKSLMLVLRIFQDGDPYFPREVLHAMKRGAKILNLSSFRDDSNSNPWDFTSFVRTLALYLDERLECFLTGKLQRRYTQKGSTAQMSERTNGLRSRRPNELVRDMKPTMLLDKISYWQRLLDRTIATRPTGEAKTNGLIQVSFYAIVQESFNLYQDVSDGLTLVLDTFFHLKYQNCVTAFQTCLKAVKQFDELSTFYASCKSMGIGRISEYPSVQVISEELIETLREYLKDQSSFSSTTKPKNHPTTLPPAPQKVRPSSNQIDSRSVQSSPTASEHGSQNTSLEDLINATGTGTNPAISIDLETYPEPRGDNMGLTSIASTRSLPVSCSFGDLMLLDDWIEEGNKKEDDKETGKEQELKQKAFPEQPPSMEGCQSFATNTSTNGWELGFFNAPAANENPSTAATTSTNSWEPALFEPMAAQPPPSYGNPFAAAKNSSYGWDLSLFETPAAERNPSAAGNSSNNGWEHTQFEATAVQPPAAEANRSSGTVNSSTGGWELALFEATADRPFVAGGNPFAAAHTSTSSWELALFEPAPLPSSTPALTNTKQPPDNHYNPFLQDPSELFGTLKDQTPIPPAATFQANPIFSTQNVNQESSGEQNVSDPFGEFSDEQLKVNAPMDPQNLVLQQQFWLQNQSKILSKNWC